MNKCQVDKMLKLCLWKRQTLYLEDKARLELISIRQIQQVFWIDNRKYWWNIMMDDYVVFSLCCLKKIWIFSSHHKCRLYCICPACISQWCSWNDNIFVANKKNGPLDDPVHTRQLGARLQRLALAWSERDSGSESHN